jgi:hypothetical protein
MGFTAVCANIYLVVNEDIGHRYHFERATIMPLFSTNFTAFNTRKSWFLTIHVRRRRTTHDYSALFVTPILSRVTLKGRSDPVVLLFVEHTLQVEA